MKRSTVKLIGTILGAIASVIIIFGAVKSGYNSWKNKDNTETTTETAQVQVLDQAA